MTTEEADLRMKLAADCRAMDEIVCFTNRLVSMAYQPPNDSDPRGAEIKANALLDLNERIEDLYGELQLDYGFASTQPGYQKVSKPLRYLAMGVGAFLTACGSYFGTEGVHRIANSISESNLDYGGVVELIGGAGFLVLGIGCIVDGFRLGRRTRNRGNQR